MDKRNTLAMSNTKNTGNIQFTCMCVYVGIFHPLRCNSTSPMGCCRFVFSPPQTGPEKNHRQAHIARIKV